MSEHETHINRYAYLRNRFVEEAQQSGPYAPLTAVLPHILKIIDESGTPDPSKPPAITELQFLRAEYEKHKGWVECAACFALIPPESSWPATANPEAEIVCWGCGPASERERALCSLLGCEPDALVERVRQQREAILKWREASFQGDTYEYQCAAEVLARISDHLRASHE